MRLIALIVARNEAWCMRATLPAVMGWADSAVVLIHASTDGTEAVVTECCRKFPGRIEVLTSDTPAWDEADYRSRLLLAGRAAGGSHFSPIDADEILTANAAAGIRKVASELRSGEMARLRWFQCWRSLHQYRSDNSPFGRARVPVLFADAPHLTYTPEPDGYQLHTRIPRGSTVRDVELPGVMHLQHVVWERVMAKQILYQINEELVYPGRKTHEQISAQYGQAVDETGLELTHIPDAWWSVDPGVIDLEAAPWQLKEAKRLLAQHGPDKFAGLSLVSNLG